MYVSMAAALPSSLALRKRVLVHYKCCRGKGFLLQCRSGAIAFALLDSSSGARTRPAGAEREGGRGAAWSWSLIFCQAT